MKFESKFGLGEIVLTHYKQGTDRIMTDAIMEIIAIQFQNDGTTNYVCEIAGSRFRSLYPENMLIGDPAFDQEKGCYSASALEEANYKGEDSDEQG